MTRIKPTAFPLYFAAISAILVYSAVSAVAFLSGDRILKAVIGMMGVLLLSWVVVGGTLGHRHRGAIQRWVQAIPVHWQIKFIVFCALMACLEEAITVSMTNCAPWFGVGYGEAYITASGNYFDVIFRHSVIVFVPMFIGWSFLLRRYAFAPHQVLLLFGATGWLAETLAFGPQNIGMGGMWIFIYGLMVYLPACCVPEERNARPPRWWHYPAAVAFPMLCLFPWAIVVGPIYYWLGLFPHPQIHFDPL